MLIVAPLANTPQLNRSCRVCASSRNGWLGSLRAFMAMVGGPQSQTDSMEAELVVSHNVGYVFTCV